MIYNSSYLLFPDIPNNLHGDSSPEDVQRRL